MIGPTSSDTIIRVSRSVHPRYSDWRRADFDISRWKNDYCKDTIKDWKRIVKIWGIEGLSKLRGSQATGRPKTKGVTDADKIKRLELQVSDPYPIENKHTSMYNPLSYSSYML